MKYTMKPVVSVDEIEKAVELQYGETIELRTLMWPSEFMNDSYKSLYFSDDQIAEYEENPDDYEEEERRQTLLVYSILKDAFPGMDEILVDVSW